MRIYGWNYAHSFPSKTASVIRPRSYSHKMQVLRAEDLGLQRIRPLVYELKKFIAMRTAYIHSPSNQMVLCWLSTNLGYTQATLKYHSPCTLSVPWVYPKSPLFEIQSADAQHNTSSVYVGRSHSYKILILRSWISTLNAKQPNRIRPNYRTENSQTTE